MEHSVFGRWCEDYLLLFLIFRILLLGIAVWVGLKSLFQTLADLWVLIDHISAFPDIVLQIVEGRALGFTCGCLDLELFYGVVFPITAVNG